MNNPCFTGYGKRKKSAFIPFFQSSSAGHPRPDSADEKYCAVDAFPPAFRATSGPGKASPVFEHEAAGYAGTGMDDQFHIVRFYRIPDVLQMADDLFFRNARCPGYFPQGHLLLHEHPDDFFAYRHRRPVFRRMRFQPCSKGENRGPATDSL
ncbi:MAG: hypothetical protein MUQ00_11305 [Candidatus Aminicenantes bacterium]|nr:hypothetical protein [Candidatus Aminicenantes bacterium]